MALGRQGCCFSWDLYEEAGLTGYRAGYASMKSPCRHGTDKHHEFYRPHTDLLGAGPDGDNSNPYYPYYYYPGGGVVVGSGNSVPQVIINNNNANNNVVSSQGQSAVPLLR